MKLGEKILRGIGIAILAVPVAIFIFAVLCRVLPSLTFKIIPDRIDFVLAFWSAGGFIALWAFNGILALGKLLKEKTRRLISNFSLFLTGLAVFLGILVLISLTFTYPAGEEGQMILSWENLLNTFREMNLIGYIMIPLFMAAGIMLASLGCSTFVKLLKKES